MSDRRLRMDSICPGWGLYGRVKTLPYGWVRLPKPSPGERVAERKRGRVWGVIVPHLSQKSEIFDSSSREEPLREGQDPPLRMGGTAI